jgi:hypothetical protein
MSSPENIRAVEFVAKALLKYETLRADYIDLLVDRVDGNISEEDWHRTVSWQYPEMLT